MTRNDASSSLKEFHIEHYNENELIEKVINFVSELIDNKNSSDDEPSKAADAMHYDIDNRFDQL